MTGGVLLDTTVLIDLLRGRAGAASRVRAARDAGECLFVSAVNVEEIARGVGEAEQAGMDRLLVGLQIVPLGESEGRRAGTWRRRFAEQGFTLSQADCLIAAAALAADARLATGNLKDFPFAELTVEHWPVGA
jgi:hypothetical protein